MQMQVTFENLGELEEFIQRMQVKASSGEEASAKIGGIPVLGGAVPTVPTTGQVIPEAPGVTTTYSHPASEPSVSQAPMSEPTAPRQTVPTSSPSYQADDLARAAMPLINMGKMNELQQLLQTFGVKALPELRPDQYGAFATALRGMGAQI